MDLSPRLSAAYDLLAQRSVFEVILPGADKTVAGRLKGWFKDSSDKPTGVILRHDWPRAREMARPIVRSATVRTIGPVRWSGLLHVRSRASC